MKRKSYKALQSCFNDLNKSAKEALSLYSARAASNSVNIPSLAKLMNVCQAIRGQLSHLPPAILSRTEEFKSLDCVLQQLAIDLEATGGKRVQVALILSSEKCEELLSAIGQLIPNDPPLRKQMKGSASNSSCSQVNSACIENLLNYSAEPAEAKPGRPKADYHTRWMRDFANGSSYAEIARSYRRSGDKPVTTDAVKKAIQRRIQESRR